MKQKAKTIGKRYIGFYNHRLNETNPREEAFSKHWRKNNTKCSWINRGNGILQDLFIADDGSWHHVMSPLSLECAVHHRCIRGCRTRQDQILGSRFDTVIGVIFKRNRACFHPREKSFFKTAGTRKR